MARSKNEETGQIVIRPPAGMRDRIKAAADANNRSMNAEIVATLEEKYPAPALPDLDVELSTMTAWLSFVDSAEDDEEFTRRLELVNKRLQGSKAGRSLRLAVTSFPDGHRALFITKHGLPDFDQPFLEAGSLRNFPPEE